MEPMEKKENLFVKNVAELIKVKTLVTLTMVGGVTYGFINGTVEPAAYLGLVGTVFGYYFAKFQSGAK